MQARVSNGAAAAGHGVHADCPHAARAGGHRVMRVGSCCYCSIGGGTAAAALSCLCDRLLASLLAVAPTARRARAAFRILTTSPCVRRGAAAQG